MAWRKRRWSECPPTRAKNREPTRQKNGKPYSPIYLKAIHSQLSAIFNYAVKYYRLKQNPAEIAGNMGKETHKEMLFWTKEEYM